MLPEAWQFFGITTSDRPERQAHLEDELARHGIPATIHVATRPSDPGGFASIGVRGCFESHLACLTLARDSNADVVVLMEDDLVLTSQLARRLATIDAELDGVQWAVLYLGYLRGQSPASSEPVALVSDHIARTRGWEIIGAQFIAFNGEHLDALIQNLVDRQAPSGHKIPVDGAYNEFRRELGAPTLVVLPSLGNQGPTPSGIMEPYGLQGVLLRSRFIRRPLERVKRMWWDATTLAPPVWHERVWNLRARRRRAPTDQEGVGR